MKPRERVICTLKHREPDKVPISLEGSAHKITDSRYFLLRDHLGIEGDGEKRLSRTTGLREEVEDLNKNSDYTLPAYCPMLSGIFEVSHYLRGMEKLLMDMILNRDFVDALLWKLTEVQGKILEVYLDIVGSFVQIVEWADDAGTQNGPMFSPKLFKEMILEKHAYLAKIVKNHAPNAKFMPHSCGSVKKFIRYFIVAVFDILNPVQPLAKNMAPAEFKTEFGQDISFLGGVDVQQTMRGPVEGVRSEVKRRIEELSPGGGLIVAPSHNSGDYVPLENMLAFFETAEEYRKY